MILITGATGNNGSETLKLLGESSFPVRAMVRTLDQGEDFPDGIEAFVGNFDDETSLEAALQGVDRAFLLTPSTERAEEQQMTFVEAAKKAAVRHIVKLSQYAADAGSPVRSCGTMPTSRRRSGTAISTGRSCARTFSCRGCCSSRL